MCLPQHFVRLCRDVLVHAPPGAVYERHALLSHCSQFLIKTPRMYLSALYYVYKLEGSIIYSVTY